VQCVLDCELVQAKLDLKQSQVALIGRFKANPDKVVGACRPLAAFIDLDIGYLAAVAVGSRGDHLAHHTPSPRTLVVVPSGLPPKYKNATVSRVLRPCTKHYI
jgi:hypothetical protein